MNHLLDNYSLTDIFVKQRLFRHGRLIKQLRLFCVMEVSLFSKICLIEHRLYLLTECQSK